MINHSRESANQTRFLGAEKYQIFIHLNIKFSFLKHLHPYTAYFTALFCAVAL